MFRTPQLRPPKLRTTGLSRLQPYAADLLARTQALRVATSRVEREAIYRFRYSVYARERGRSGFDGVDHGRQWIRLPDDESAESVHYYFGSPARIVATVKVRSWAPGCLPEDLRSLYQTEALEGLEALQLCDTTQLMVSPDRRGSWTMLAMTLRAGEHAIRHFGVQAALATSAPGLVAPYRRLGYRDFGAKPLVKDVMLVPMVYLVGDVAHARRSGALWGPTIHRLAREGVVADVSGSELARRIERSQRLIVDPAGLRRCLRAAHHSTLSALPEAAMDWLLQGAVAMEIAPGTRVTAQGVREHELYLALSGDWELTEADGSRRHLSAGAIFGAAGYFSEDRKRPHTVRTIDGGRALMIRHSRLRIVSSPSPNVARAQRALYGAIAR